MTTEPTAEPINAVEQISGPEVIQDLAHRLGECLSRECHLQPSDAYESYSAVLTAKIQLRAIDSVTVTKKLTVGDHDPSSLSHPITIEVAQATADEVRSRNDFEPSTLERDVAGNPLAPTEKRQARYYTPRNSIPTRAAS